LFIILYSGIVYFKGIHEGFTVVRPKKTNQKKARLLQGAPFGSWNFFASCYFRPLADAIPLEIHWHFTKGIQLRGWMLILMSEAHFFNEEEH